ncbi:MAG: hypothetical protein V4676_07265 [Bacteroidota bacterium]
MQRNLRLFALMAFTTAVAFTSCKKETSQNTDEPTEMEMNTHSDDQSSVSNEMDAVTTEFTGTLEANADFAGAKVSQTAAICGAIAVADTANQLKRITITYSGDNCAHTHTRQGSVLITMALGTKWKDAGANISVTYQNLVVTRKADNKSITISGTHTLTNVTGGLLRNLAISSPITHTLTSSNMSITFANATQRMWQVARKRDFTFSGGAILTITGMHSANGQTGIAEWGSDRFNRAFTTSITSPIVIKQDCGFRITSGAVQHTRHGVTATVTFGLDAAGLPTVCPGANAFYFKLSWTGLNGNVHTHILPY